MNEKTKAALVLCGRICEDDCRRGQDAADASDFAGAARWFGYAENQAALAAFYVQADGL